MLSMLPLAGLATFLWFMASPPTRREGVIGNIATTVFGIAYIAVPAGLALDLLQRPGGKRLPAREFLQGLAIQPGQRFASRA